MPMYKGKYAGYLLVEQVTHFSRICKINWEIFGS